MGKIVLGILAAVFLLGSFPIRSCYGTVASDSMRVIGFILMLAFIALKYHKKYW